MTSDLDAQRQAESSASVLSFELPAKVEFGPGRIGVLQRVIEENDFERVAFVMTAGRRRSGAFAPAIAELERSGVEVTIFDRVESNPTIQSVGRCVRALRRFGPHAVIGIGGGSALDTCKAAAACLANRTEDPSDLLDDTRALRRATPTILIPTTAGTGSEVNYWAVISDPERREKLSIGNPKMAPFVAIIDPSLALSLPPDATLWSGVDALTHAVEAFISSAGNWLSDMFCLGSVSLIAEWLPWAITQGDDLAARGSLALASLLAGAAMENVGLGLVHAISHQVSAFYDTPHGRTNAVLLPHVLAFNSSACEAKISTLDGLVKDAGTLRAWLDWLLRSNAPREEPIRVRTEDIPEMARRAASNVNALTNPRKASEAEIAEILRGAFEAV